MLKKMEISFVFKLCLIFFKEHALFRLLENENNYHKELSWVRYLFGQSGEKASETNTVELKPNPVI